MTREQELTCYAYSLRLTEEFFEKGDYKRAAAHSRNATRSLGELRKLKDKEAEDLSVFVNEFANALQKMLYEGALK